MTRHIVPMSLIGLMALMGITGCSEDKTIQVERYSAALSEAGLAVQSVSEFTIALNGDEAGVTTAASGTATLSLAKLAIDYTIELNDIGTTVQTVGLYLGSPGAEGILAGMFFVGNEPGPINGILAEGTLPAEALQGVTFSAVVDSMRTGNAYVLVGTMAEPSGELRGQTGPRGDARFLLSGSRITWEVGGQIISGVTSVGIYSGRQGVNGSLRVSLFEGGPTGVINGVIAGGEFGASDIDELTLSELTGQMKNGDAYVLVTTSERPDGRMRGQIFLQF